MRTSNPTLGDNTFQNVALLGEESMTIQGTVNKSLTLMALLVFSAAISWTQFDTSIFGLYVWGGAILGFITAIVTTFKKEWSSVTAPLYAVFEGLFLGGISVILENQFAGIVGQAVFLTIGTFFCLLMAYKSGYIKATENFKLGIVAATGAIALIYLATTVLRLFGMNFPYIHDNGVIGIGFSLVVVVIAALNLVLDFDFIEQGAEQNAPKYMEWYAAFGLVVTLVWLYLEILRLLAKLNKR